MIILKEVNEKYFKRCLNAWIEGYADKNSLSVWKNAGRISEQQYNEIINTPRPGDPPKIEEVKEEIKEEAH